jgi:hypothetical protein
MVSSNITKLAPEGFEIANAYLEYGTVEEVARQMQLPQHEVAAALTRKDVKDYLDGVYLDMGYRNRSKLGALLDEMIDAKIEEAKESGVYTKKDLLDLITLAHKMRMDEINIAQKPNIGTHVQIANFGEGQYGKLMEKLLGNQGTR